MRELKLLQRGAAAAALTADAPVFDTEDLEDLEDAPGEEAEAAEQEILDQATAARTIDELKVGLVAHPLAVGREVQRRSFSKA